MNNRYTEVRTTKDGKKYEVEGVTLVGNLTKDVPTAREVEVNGEKRMVLNSLDTSIACNFSVPKENGEGWEKKTIFYPFTLWGPRGKFFQTLKRGDGLTVKGYIKNEENTYERDGKTHSTTKEVVIIEDFTPHRRSSSQKAESGTSMEIDGEDVPF